MTFIERPRNRKSDTGIYGIGINDADYVVQPTEKGKQQNCRFYTVWQNMLKRCYCLKYQATQPTYVGCTVHKDWHRFSTFKAWMEKQDCKDKQLDKDILEPNNKIYGPDTCVFVTHEINQLLTDRAADRGEYPVGVCKMGKKYKAQCRIKGQMTYLGVFDTTEEAHLAYVQAKVAHIREIARQEPEGIKQGLFRHVRELLDTISA